MTWNLCGHETAISFLKEHTRPEKLRHAYLITGSEGVGRRTLALAFIKALNCTNPPKLGEFCNECLVCRQINTQAFADLTVLAPDEGHKDLKIDQIRAMQQTLALAPYQAKFRIILILDFQRATAAASNALLKSLEEPPTRAIILLTADAQESLLETIASRCEILRLRPLPVEAARQCLEEQWGLSAERAGLLAHLTSGRIGAAMRFEQNPNLINIYQDTLEKLEELLPAKNRQRLKYVESQLKQKGNLREVVHELVSSWLTFWRDVLIAYNEATIPLVNHDKADLVRKTAGQMESGEVEKILKAHEKALEQLDKYVNPRLVVENLLLLIPRLRS